MRAFVTVFDMTHSNNFKIGFLNKKTKLAPSSKIKTNMEITADLDLIDTSIDSKIFLVICIASLVGFSFILIVIVIFIRKCCVSPKLRLVK
jgi:sensor c-di-GMP phosphodiesterase-like protein